MGMNLIQTNVRSLSQRKDILEAYINQNDIDIVLLSETWTNDDSIDTIKFKNYNLLLRNRADGYGGVGILLKKDIEHYNIIRSTYNTIECISTRIKLFGYSTHITIVSIYIPPKTKTSVLEVSFKKLIEDFNHPHVIIAGDINAHNNLWENHSSNDRKGQIIAEIISDSNFIVLNTGEHTHNSIKNNSTSALDVTIISRDLIKQSTWHVGENITSDHLPTHTTISLSRQPLAENNRKYLNKKNILLEVADLKHQTAENIIEWEKNITDIIDQNTIVTNKHKKYSPKVWWTKEIENLWQIKNLKQKLFSKFKSPYTAIELRKTNNKLKNLIRQTKKDKWEDYLNSINPTSSLKEIWNNINKQKYIAKPKNILTSPTAIESFLKHNFIEDSITFAVEKPQIDNDEPFKTDNISKWIKGSKNSAPGPNNISYEILKTIPEEYIGNLSSLFNNIWKSMEYPPAWKKSRVIGIPKPGKDSKDPKNYRPICLQQTNSKLFNKYIKEELEKHIEKYNILSDRSFGFRKGVRLPNETFSSSRKESSTKKETNHFIN